MLNEILISISLALSQLSIELEKRETVGIVQEFPGFANLPVAFQKTIICESGGRQFNSKGKVLISPTKDKGILQINSKIHEKNALKMGHDINTLEGNLAYGWWLYQHGGLKHWVCAKRLGFI